MWRWGLCLALCAGAARSQVITTVAGTDTVFPVSGVSALNAPLRDTSAVAVDGAGNIYITDTSNNIVVRVSTAGIVTVAAGNGRAGLSGDGGAATAASLSSPYGIAIDASGDLYIADYGNNRVRKVSAGIITTVAGSQTNGPLGDGGPATNATLDEPVGVALDSAGNLYISEYGANRVRRVSGGVITTVAGNGREGFSGDNGPATSAMLNLVEGIAVDVSGALYIADTGNNRVRRVANGTITTVAGTGDDLFSGDGGPAISAGLRRPYGVAVDAAGALYIADFGNNRVRKVSAGTITTVAGSEASGFAGDGGPATKAALMNPYSVAVDGAGNLFIADGSRRLRKVSGGTISTVAGNGTAGFSGDGGPATAASLSSPSSVAVGGALYIADSGNSRIRSVSSGIITTAAGNGTVRSSGDGGPATSASLVNPVDVAIDSAGNLYIADADANRIRKVSGGTITTVAGNGNYDFSGDDGPATSAALAGPTGVAVDNAGNLYIADYGNNRVRKVSGGLITTVAGSGTQGNSGDGGPALSASLSDPSGVAVDAAGNLYIAEHGNNRIRKVSGGTITAFAGTGQFDFKGDGGPATSAAFNGLVGIATDASGSLYVADYGNNRVRKISGGTITTVAGNGTAGFSGDGGSPLKASLNGPTGVAVDAAGKLYIADSANFRIRAVLSGAVSYQASPSSLTLSGVAGGAPTQQVVNLSSTVPGLAFSVVIRQGSPAGTPGSSWLAVTPTDGTIPAALQVTADPSALSAGTYQATIAIDVPNASPAQTSISVTFNVQAATTAALAVDPQSISFAATQGGNLVSQPLHISNMGAGSLDFSAAASTSSGGAWLSLSATSGTATASAPASISVIATPGSLAPGTYSGMITISGGGKTIPIPVTLSVSAATPVILLSQSALTFNAVAQGGVPLPQTFGILNTGQGSMSWAAKATTISGGDWLHISSSSGTVSQPFLDVSRVDVSIDPSTLGAGTYFGQIQVSSAAANSPQVITVILNVLPAGSTLPAQVFPAGLIFTGTAGTTPGSQDVQIGNPAGQPNSFLSGIIGTGFSYLPTNATVAPNQPTVIHVYPDFSSLTPGSLQRGTITLQFADGSPSQTISVLEVVAPAGSGSSAGSGHFTQAGPAASGCSSAGLLVVLRAPQPSQSAFTAVVGQASSLEVAVTDQCGNLVGQTASVAAHFSNHDSVSMTHIGSGVWQGTWRPLNPGTVSMFITTLVAGPNGTILAGQSTILTAVVSAPTAAAVTPAVTAQGVVHSASAQGGLPISPGGLVTIYGQNLSDTSGAGGGLPLPEQLNGTQVLLGDQPLPILYTSPGQLNLQVPYGVPVNTQYQLTVQHGLSYSVPQQLVVAQAEPGVFTMNQQGFGQGAILKSDGVTLAQPGTPASIGETVVIYCTGLGSVTPNVKAGSPAPGGPPPAATDNPVSVTIGGMPAAVSFSGLTPGSVGLYQVNAVVPTGIPTGDAVPVVIAVAGQTSPPVTIAVR